ncbi:MAG: hypothetical protein ACODAJ_10280 [Planctomycetota bacterium]
MPGSLTSWHHLTATEEFLREIAPLLVVAGPDEDTGEEPGADG